MNESIKIDDENAYYFMRLTVTCIELHYGGIQCPETVTELFAIHPGRFDFYWTELHGKSFWVARDYDERIGRYNLISIESAYHRAIRDNKTPIFRRLEKLLDQLKKGYWEGKWIYTEKIYPRAED